MTQPSGANIIVRKPIGQTTLDEYYREGTTMGDNTVFTLMARRLKTVSPHPDRPGYFMISFQDIINARHGGPAWFEAPAGAPVEVWR